MNVGAAQIRVSAKISDNLKKIAAYVKKAKKRRLDLLVFPECCVTGYLPSIRRKPAGRIVILEALDEVRSLARDSKIALVVGASFPERRGLFNRSFAISRTGRVVATYDKVHLTGGDAKFYRRGRRLETFRFSGVPCDMQICLDHRYPEGWRVLAAKGAKVVVHVVYMHGRRTTWKVPVIEAHLRSRAAENGIFVVSSNVAYSPANHLSMIVDPRGLVLAKASSGREQLINAKIDPSRATHTYLKGRRKDLFGAIKKGS